MIQGQNNGPTSPKIPRPAEIASTNFKDFTKLFGPKMARYLHFQKFATSMYFLLAATPHFIMLEPVRTSAHAAISAHSILSMEMQQCQTHAASFNFVQ